MDAYEYIILAMIIGLCILIGLLLYILVNILTNLEYISVKLYNIDMSIHNYISYELSNNININKSINNDNNM